MSERTLVFEVEMIFDDENGGTEVPNKDDLRDILEPAAAMAWAEMNIDLRTIFINVVADSRDDEDED